MEIGYVTKNEIDALGRLFLPGVAEQIKNGLPITALAVSDGGTAVGAIAGWVEGYSFWIISLYVAPEYRRKGLGRDLVEALVPMLSDNQLDMSADFVITCEEHETLVPFFEAMGFDDETDEIVNTYEIEINDLKGYSFFKKNGGNVMTLDEIPERVLKNAEQRASDAGLPTPAEGLCGKGVERAISTAQVVNGEIRALVALDRSCAGKLTLACAWGNDDNPAALPSLLRASFSKIVQLCPDDTQIIIQTISDASAALVHAMAPDAEPIERIFTKHIVLENPVS